MKHNLKIFIAASAVVFMVASCGGKGASVDAALSQIEKAMDKVEKNKTSMTEADWQAFSEELEGPVKILNEALESDRVGALKKLKITAVMLRYAAVVGEAAFHTAAEELQKTIPIGEQFADSLSAATNELQEALGSDEMKEAMQEAQKALEGLQKFGQ